MIEKTITIELSDNMMSDAFTVKQYDEGYNLNFGLYYNGQKFDLSKIVSVLEIKKPDGTKVIEQCSNSDNIAKCKLTKQMTVLSGRAKWQLTLFDAASYQPDSRESAIIFSTMTGVLHINESAVTNNDIESSDVINIISDVLIQLEDAKNTTQLCKSYAIGGSGIREGEDTDNAKYYCEQMQSLIDSIENGDEVKY